MRYISSIVAAVKNIKDRERSFSHKYSSPTQKLNKEESLKAIDEGRCQMCGEKEGNEKAICDDCRWS